MPPKRKEETEVRQVTTVGRVDSLPPTNSQSSSPPCYTTARESQDNSTRQNSFSFEGTSFHQEQPIYNSNSSLQLSAVPSTHVVSLSTSTSAPSFENISPQTSVIVAEDGDMPMQEDVRLNIARVSAQTANGSQIECPLPNGELPPRILYDGKYQWLCVVLFAERSVHCACELGLLDSFGFPDWSPMLAFNANLTPNPF